MAPSRRSLALVGGQDDQTLLIAFADQLEEASGGEGAQRQLAHVVEDQELGLTSRAICSLSFAEPCSR